MIVWLAIAVLALALGGVLGALMLRDPGYVLIAYGDASVETSLWFAAAAAVIAWLACGALVALARRARRGGDRLRDWRASGRRRANREHATRGAMLLAEERWREAGKALLAQADDAAGLLDYLAAARAANAVQDYAQRDLALERAKAAIPAAHFAAELTRAELQQAAAEWSESVTTLNALRERAPGHPLVLERLHRAYRALEDWDAVASLAPSLPDGVTAETQVAAWLAKFRAPADGDPLARAKEVWSAVPKALRNEETLRLAYADALAAHGAPADAEAALREGLKRRWAPAWVRRYGEIAVEPERQRVAASAWLKGHPDDPTLHLTLGRLAAADGDVEQAKRHFEESARAEPNGAALAELGGLCVASGEAEAANEYYRRALGKLYSRKV